ncbi:cyclase family protein [bacterium]|nr:cyclase family protein [bacterium]
MDSFPFSAIDLTHPIGPETPQWPGDPDTRREPHAGLPSHGYTLNAWRIGEHTGTHLGAPGHRVRDGATVDQLAADELVRPLVVVAAGSRENDRLAVTVADLQAFESKHGAIPVGACVALHTGWDNHWPDQDRVFERGTDDGFLWPGWSPEAVDWLVRERNVSVIASDAPDIGAGDDRDLRAGLVCAEHGLPHVENLANLDRVPPCGSFIVLGALPLQRGTGSPIRAFALTPKST